MEIKLYLKMIQRSWWIVLLTALAAVLAALISAYVTPPVYRASARYIVSPNPVFLGDEVDYNLIYSLDTLDKRTIITTYAEVLNSPRIYTESIALSDLQDVDLTNYSYLATVLPETNIIDFAVQGPNPEMVVVLTNRIGQHAVQYAENLYQIYDMTLLDPATVPVDPISPQPVRDAGVALVVGSALGVALALLRELLRAPIVNFMQQRKLDGMSSALNRRSFEESLKEIAFASTTDFCLCLVRMEGLQDYLNILPQPTMQIILQHITHVMKNELRGNDLVGRWNELDFSVILSDTPGAAAFNTMRRVQASLSAPVKIDISGEDLHLDPKIGIAEYRIGDTANSLVKNTNWALEIAKKNGGMYLLKATEAL
jgi:diguanylate cyclase (GGDEF)-like protein